MQAKRTVTRRRWSFFEFRGGRRDPDRVGADSSAGLHYEPFGAARGNDRRDSAPRRLRAGFLAAVIGAFALALAATPAMADTVIRFPVPPGFHGTRSGICAFDFTITPVRANQTEADYYDTAGALERVIVTGDAIYSYQNVSTGRTLIANNSAAQKVYFNPDGSVTLDISGPQVFVEPLLAIGGPPTQWLIGGEHTVYEISPTGNVTLVQKVGQFQDICQLLS